MGLIARWSTLRKLFWGLPSNFLQQRLEGSKNQYNKDAGPIFIHDSGVRVPKSHRFECINIIVMIGRCYTVYCVHTVLWIAIQSSPTNVSRMASLYALLMDDRSTECIRLPYVGKGRRAEVRRKY